MPDLYLRHADMLAVGRAHAPNPLMQGRGQPGTHDVALGSSILRALRSINDHPDKSVQLPVYDKSAWDGQGDRAADAVTVHGPIDLVLFEGWCLGFHALSQAEIEQKLRMSKGKSGTCFTSYSADDLAVISENLGVWEREWYPLLDAFIQFHPCAEHGKSPWSMVYPWRLQAEHAMKRANGGRGMTDEQVAAFVQRYAFPKRLTVQVSPELRAVLHRSAL